MAASSSKSGLRRVDEEGLRVERRLFTELVTGPQSAAQRYYFFAERAANKIPDIPRDTPLVDIRSAGILGAGTMGGGIAMNFANAGIPVTIVERDAAALERGLAVVRSNYERSAARGSIAPAAVDERMGLITGSTDGIGRATASMLAELGHAVLLHGRRDHIEILAQQAVGGVLVLAGEPGITRDVSVQDRGESARESLGIQ